MSRKSADVGIRRLPKKSTPNGKQHDHRTVQHQYRPTATTKTISSMQTIQKKRSSDNLVTGSDKDDKHYHPTTTTTSLRNKFESRPALFCGGKGGPGTATAAGTNLQTTAATTTSQQQQQQQISSATKAAGKMTSLATLKKSVAAKGGSAAPMAVTAAAAAAAGTSNQKLSPITDQIDPKTQAVFDKKNYRLLEEINHGAFGYVYKGEYLVDGTPVAIKVMDLKKLNNQLRSKYIPMEMKTLIECRHKNIVQIYDIFRAKDMLYMIMEYCSNGDLSGFIRHNGPATETQSRQWFAEVVDALKYLHRELRFAHRDMKLDNVLLDAEMSAKVTDFGLATCCWDPKGHHVILSGTICGTAPYQCPQLVQKIQYNAFLADVWALGVMLFCLFHARFPFAFDNPATMLQQQTNYPKYLQTIWSPPAVGPLLPPDAFDCCLRMLHPDEKTRASLREVAKHPWVTGYTGRNRATGSRTSGTSLATVTTKSNADNDSKK